MPRLGLDDLIFPLLMEKEKERKTEARRKDREARVADLALTLQNPNASAAAKAKAAAGLAGAGMSVPANMWLSKPKRPDLSFAKLPPEVQYAYDVGVFDESPNPALKALETAKWGESLGDNFSLEDAKKAGETLGWESGQAEKFYAIRGLSKYLTKEEMTQQVFGGAAKEPTDAEIKRQLMDKTLYDAKGTLVSAKVMFGPEGARNRGDWIKGGGTMDELYGIYGMDTSAIPKVRKDLEAEAVGKLSFADADVDQLDQYINLWATGQGVPDKIEAILNQYYDKTTRKLKEELVAGELESNRTAAIEQTGLVNPMPSSWKGTYEEWLDFLRRKGK